MIKINLIEKKKPVELPIILGIDFNKINKKPIIFSMVVYYVVTSFVIADLKSMNNEYREDIASKRAEIKTIQKKIKGFGPLKETILAFNKRIKQLQDRENLVQEVMDKKSNPYKVLRAISNTLNDDIWFNDLSIGKNNDIIINGESLSFSSVRDFITNVKELEYFIGGNNSGEESFGIKEIKEEQDNIHGEDLTIQKFSVKGKVYSYGDLD